MRPWIKFQLSLGNCPSENAVKTQIWIAISVYLLVAILEKELNIDRSLGEILQILSVTLFEKEPLYQLLTQFENEIQNVDPAKQLTLFD